MLSLSAVAAYSAQDVAGPDNDQAVAPGAPKSGTELLVVGDGDDPWPEAKQVRTVRKKVRRTNPDTGPDTSPVPYEEPSDPFEDYLNALTYTKSPLPLRKPPGMLVVDYDQYSAQMESDSATSAQPGQLIGETPPGAFAGPAQQEPPDNGQSRSVGYSFGGNSVNDAEAPWQAQIYYPNIADEWRAKLKLRVPLWAMQHFCGGALIAENWVVTAAHCIDDGMRRNGYRIRLGQEDVSRPGGYTYKIDRVVVHPRYVAREKAGDLNDIALIKISNDTGHAKPNWAQVHPIGLYRQPPPPANRPMSIYGWGRTNANTAWNGHAFLMRVGLNVMPHSECTPFAKQLRWALDDTIICAKAPTGTKRKTCKGDSGGPVVSSGKLLAVVSGGGDRCTGDGVPSMYTRIAAYLPWIDGTTGRTAR
jgi:Trypsin